MIGHAWAKNTQDAMKGVYSALATAFTDMYLLLRFAITACVADNQLSQRRVCVTRARTLQ